MKRLETVFLGMVLGTSLISAINYAFKADLVGFFISIGLICVTIGILSKK